MAKQDIDIANRVKNLIVSSGRTPTSKTLDAAAGKTVVVTGSQETDDDDDIDGLPSREPASSGGGTARSPVNNFDPDADLEDDDEDEPAAPAAGSEEDEPGDQPPADEKEKSASAKDNATLLEQMSAMRAELNKYKEAEERKTLIDGYVANGYDADTAAEMADNRLDRQRLRDEVDTIRALNKYRKVFATYGVEDKGEELIAFAKAANMAPDEYCRKVYGGREPASITRARASAKGEVPEEDVPNRPASGSTIKGQLTAKDREHIAFMRENGIPVDEKAYLARKQARAQKG